MPYGTNNPPSRVAKALNILSLGFTGAVDGTSDYNRQKAAQMQAAIDDQRQQAQADREFADDAANYGVNPVRNPDGSLNRIATAGRVQKMKDALDSAKITRDAQARSQQSLGDRAAAVGIDPSAQPSVTQTPGWSVMANPPAAKPLAQRVVDAEAAKKLTDATNQRQSASDIAMAQSRAQNAAKEIDSFRSAFSRDPGASELTNEGYLNANALGAMKQAATNKEKGFMADPTNPGSLVPIPGGIEDQKRKDAATGAAAKQQMLSDTTSALLDNIATAMPLVGVTTSGVIGGRTSGINQSAQDLHSVLDAIKSGLGVNMLNEMRASSSNGSTGIGRVMQVEFDAFSKAARNLNQLQSPAQLRQNLMDLQTHLQRWQDAKQKLDVQSPQSPPPSPSPAPAGSVADDILRKRGLIK